jgi:hypothetical protein
MELEETDEQLQAWVADPKWIHFAALIQRPGVGACAETLEHAHYKPGTPANDLFNLRLIPFGGFPWALISIPLEDRPKMERAAAASGLRVANGVPTMIGPEGVTRFPVDNERIFTLENVSGHPVYKNQGGRR